MMYDPNEHSCADKVYEEFLSRMNDIRLIMFKEPHPDINIKYSQEDLDRVHEYLPEEIYEYGLCIDYVEPGTFEGQRDGYIRYQLSWGGPSEEFRIYKNGDVEFWFLDWFDGAPLELKKEDADIIKQIVEPIACEYPEFENIV